MATGAIFTVSTALTEVFSHTPQSYGLATTGSQPIAAASPGGSFLIQLEDGSGFIQLEDGSGNVELEAGP